MAGEGDGSSNRAMALELKRLKRKANEQELRLLSKDRELREVKEHLSSVSKSLAELRQRSDLEAQERRKRRRHDNDGVPDEGAANGGGGGGGGGLGGLGNYEVDANGLEWPQAAHRALAAANRTRRAFDMILATMQFDESSSCFYDGTAQYYYDPVTTLYYDPSSETFLRFQLETKTFHRHSILPSQDEGSTGPPPNMLCLVVEDSAKDAIGTVFRVGMSSPAVMGRSHRADIQLSDFEASKEHARVGFDPETGRFTITDLGSRNGTWLNEEEMEDMVAVPLAHLDFVGLGSTGLAVHLHPAGGDCKECRDASEPVLPSPEPDTAAAAAAVAPVVSQVKRVDLESARRAALAMLKGKYGTTPAEAAERRKRSQTYRDRAKVRQVEVGSEYSEVTDRFEAADVDRPLAEDNKGRSMLKAMGWSEGTALGKTGDGVVEPIANQGQVSRAGLGAEPEPPPMDRAQAKRARIHESTVARWADAQAVVPKGHDDNGGE